MWFEVDREGLAQLLDRRGRHRVILEPLSNVFDEDGVTHATITLVSKGERGIVEFSIEDDSPTGWRNLSDAWTLYASSYKKNDPTKRGRFNLGEKLFLSLCETATITSTTGTVRFNAKGRTELKTCRPVGSRFEARLRFTKRDLEKAEALLRTVLVPDGITVTFNGEVLASRKPVHSFNCSLPTEFEDDAGQWHDTARQTTVELYEVLADEKPTIYEMGIPVVEERDSRWHCSVEQKVPLNTDRDNCTPSYLRRLREVVLNNSFRLLNAEDANSVWVRDAIPKANADALDKVLTERFGEKRVISDMSDPEANKIAASQGFSVIAPRSFSKDEWANIKAHDLVKPAGQVTPSNSHVLSSADGVPPLPAEKLTPGQERVIEYAKEVARVVLGVEITVDIHSMPLGVAWAACYGNRGLKFNLARLGHKWFDEPSEQKIDELLIHEFAHHYSGDHLSSDYHDALCAVGAKFKQHADKLSFIDDRRTQQAAASSAALVKRLEEDDQ